MTPTLEAIPSEPTPLTAGHAEQNVMLANIITVLLYNHQFSHTSQSITTHTLQALSNISYNFALCNKSCSTTTNNNSELILPVKFTNAHVPHVLNNTCHFCHSSTMLSFCLSPQLSAHPKHAYNNYVPDISQNKHIATLDIIFKFMKIYYPHYFL